MCHGSIWIIGVQKYPDISTQYALRQTAGLTNWVMNLQDIAITLRQHTILNLKLGIIT